jgi:molybdopterin molybdotransferase
MKKLTYLDYKDAVDAGIDLAIPITRKEKIPLNISIGRILASDVICVKNVPSFNNSAMDGFAYKASINAKQFKVKGIILAGDNKSYEINENEAYRIMTGAQIPNGADTIIPVEDCDFFDENIVRIPKGIKKRNHYRKKGEDYSLNELIFKKGQTINSMMISLLACQGMSMIDVISKLNIAVLSTGSELKEPWQNASENDIYNSNSYGIISILKEENFDANYIGIIPDNLEETVKFIKDLKAYDLIISTGGISMGDADFVAEAFIQNGLEIEFHGVNVKPGRPTMMGKMDNTFVMAMPGNPLTALVNTKLLALPIVYKLSGGIEYYYDFIFAKNNEEFNVKSNRANVVLGNLKNGEFTVTKKNKYGSGMFSPIIDSNCVMVSLNNKDLITKDEIIKVIPFGIGFKSFKSDIYS